MPETTTPTQPEPQPETPTETSPPPSSTPPTSDTPTAPETSPDAPATEPAAAPSDPETDPAPAEAESEDQPAPVPGPEGEHESGDSAGTPVDAPGTGEPDPAGDSATPSDSPAEGEAEDTELSEAPAASTEEPVDEDEDEEPAPAASEAPEEPAGPYKGIADDVEAKLLERLKPVTGGRFVELGNDTFLLLDNLRNLDKSDLSQETRNQVDYLVNIGPLWLSACERWLSRG